MVDRECVPVGLGEREQTAAAQHAVQLGQYRGRVGHVHQNAVGARTVDARGLERQLMGVGLVHLDISVRLDPCSSRNDHRGIPVDADDAAARPHLLGERGEIGGRPAADVEHPSTRPDAQGLEQLVLVRAGGPGGGDAVEVRGRSGAGP
jgi:hypothetical protein